MIAQIIILLLMAGRLVVDFIDHGKPVTSNVNFWRSLGIVILIICLHYLGGFFKWVF